ncbi:hypothetical protein ABLG96_13075 [Nakamurella sp. A5-74]|uniref:Uncharacterized protein n=1 Tax=Nakamurella sp. A5-74 TaxID=3158264 RepID=A0AAU8DLV4_9ACTN
MIDLRLLAALTGAGGSVGLPHAAWNAGIAQADAAARLVQLAESGFPLRLVVEGDARLLHQVIERGPVVGAPPTPPTNASPAPGSSESAPAAATWGLPGSGAWARRDPSAVPSATRPAQDADDAPTSPRPSTPPSVAAGQPQRTVGLADEHLSVTVSQIVDPATDVLTAAGYVLDPAERAVLVHSVIANHGPAAHDCLPDLYLVLVGADGGVLQKAPVSVAGYPAHRVGVAPGRVAEGWTVFLIGATTDVEAVRWSVRPDLIDRTLNWSPR